MKAFIQHQLYTRPRLARIAQKLYHSIPAKLRVAKDFLDWLAFFRESESWSVAEHRHYQLERLNAVCSKFSARNPAFRERFGGEGGVSWRSLEDYSARVPAMTKDEFETNMKSSYPADIKSSMYKLSGTSGTTGRALQFYHRSADWHREFAAICHQWARVGFDALRSRRVEFRGLTVSRGGIDYYPKNGMVRCNILDFSPDAVRRYGEVIAAEGLKFYHGYPSALTLLASTIMQRGLKFPQPSAVLLASEMAYDWQLELLEEVFPKARLYAHYGCAERAVLAGWCEQRREYHVLPTYAYVETNPGSGEVIGTNLFNDVNPFLRYRMTDVALGVDNEPCPDCGRNFVPRFAAIGGRSEDYLFSPEHGWIPPAIVTYPLKRIHNIREIQVVQDRKDAIEVRYTVHEGAQEAGVAAEMEEVRGKFLEMMGRSMAITFSRVSEFERGATGKFKWIVSDIDGPIGARCT